MTNDAKHQVLYALYAEYQKDVPDMRMVNEQGLEMAFDVLPPPCSSSRTRDIYRVLYGFRRTRCAAGKSVPSIWAGRFSPGRVWSMWKGSQRSTRARKYLLRSPSWPNVQECSGWLYSRSLFSHS